jgi:hypothetical protein
MAEAAIKCHGAHAVGLFAGEGMGLLVAAGAGAAPLRVWWLVSRSGALATSAASSAYQPPPPYYPTGSVAPPPY